MSTSIVLLAYNEAENLKILLPRIKRAVQKMGIDYEILIIDSAKPTDNTEEVAIANGAKYIPQEEPYYGGAFRTGIKYASKEHLLVLDADGSHDPKDIPAIHKKYAEGYDMVIGSRYVKGGVSNDSKSSFVMSKILNTTMRIVIGVKAKDISTSYRLYNTKQIKAVELVRDNYDVLQEVILKMKINKRKKHQKFRIGETPIVFNKRMYGESKRQLFKFIKGYIVTVFMLLGINIQSMIRDK
ncbi:MAG: glycosyltransferase [Lachnospiraceae bacterium]|nr:glycosyltransferase [Lachnospiraceae bacterium]MDE7434572.1 glycosyltransferase [Lachnospiraceae bacterium]